MDYEIGSVVGDYEIVKVLGAGGMGEVYQVRNSISGRIEAMKVLLPGTESNPELVDRFMREIKVVRLIPMRSAAPSAPATRPFVAFRMRKISSRSASCRSGTW